MLRLLPTFLVLLVASSVSAHDVMGTVIYVDLGRTRAHLTVELPVDELRLAWHVASYPGVSELPGSGAEIASYVLQHLQLKTPQGAAFKLSAQPGEVVLHDNRNWQRIEVDAAPPPDASPRDFWLVSDLINHQVVSHHIFIFLRRDLEAGHVDDDPVYLASLHYQVHEAHVRQQGSVGVALRSVFKLGMEHIAQGYDHLLFVFTLLLPAGLGTRASLLGIVRLVTAFTLGHSLTLLLGALGLAHLPSALVESLIALSVMVTAVHAAYPLFPRREAWVALGFGLVHGLGFASALDGLGIDGSTLALTVLGFNLGVEVMQALLVLACLPLLLLLQRTRLGMPFRLAGAAVSFAIALIWFAERSSLLA